MVKTARIPSIIPFTTTHRNCPQPPATAKLFCSLAGKDFFHSLSAEVTDCIDTLFVQVLEECLGFLLPSQLEVGSCQIVGRVSSGWVYLMCYFQISDRLLHVPLLQK